MIKTLELKNFRGIKEGKIELAPMTILIGPNNSGKTTILEALYLAPNPFRKAPYGVQRAIGIIHEFHQTLESRGYLFLLRNYTSNEAKIKCDGYTLTFTKENNWIHVDANKAPKMSVNIPLIKLGIGEEKETVKFALGKLGVYTDDISVVSDESLIWNVLFFSSNLRQRAFEYIRNEWASIINLGICKKVSAQISNFIWENIKDITIEPFGGKLTINAYLEDGRRIRLGDMGEGIQSYLLIRILHEYLKPDILLWDDVEAHMNPRMLLAVGDWFSKLVEGGVQVIVSTHSLEAVRTLASLVEGARICLTALEDGVLRVRALTLDEVEELLEAGVDVRASAEVLI